MGILKKAVNLILYAGLSEKNYHSLLPSIYAQNQIYLRIYSLIAAVLFILLEVAGALTKGFLFVNIPVFAACFCVSVAILLCSYLLTPRYPRLTFPLVFLYECLLYAFSITVSLLHPEFTAVSAVAFLLVSPLLFYVRPFHQICLTVIVMVAFNVIVQFAKAPQVAEADFWNLGSYGIVGILEGVFTTRIKFRLLYQERNIVYLSETDILTGVKNRNCYEQRLRSYPEKCKEGLVCVYTDVNGLHEMNNTAGHGAGDKMLQAVAAELRARYGAEHTYRIGGDEFVAFGPDRTADSAREALTEISGRLQEQTYHISFGISYGRLPLEGDVFALVREAESEMYRAKSEYYRQPGHSRRRR